METEIVIRGYPVRRRLAEWRKATSLPESQLPELTPEEKRRAGFLRVSERGFAVALKANEFARDFAFEALERVATRIGKDIKERHPGTELKTVVWDFGSDRFEFVTQRNLEGRVQECAHEMAPSLIEEVVLGCYGAEGKLIEAAQKDLTLAVQ